MEGEDNRHETAEKAREYREEDPWHYNNRRRQRRMSAARLPNRGQSEHHSSGRGMRHRNMREGGAGPDLPARFAVTNH